MGEEDVKDLLAKYIELSEMQDEVIRNLSALLEKQNTELANLRNLLKCEIAK